MKLCVCIYIYTIWRRREIEREAGAREERYTSRATSAKCCSLSSSVDGWLEKNCFCWDREQGGRGRQLDFSYRAEAFSLVINHSADSPVFFLFLFLSPFSSSSKFTAKMGNFFFVTCWCSSQEKKKNNGK